jgi:hypothetical protein
MAAASEVHPGRRLRIKGGAHGEEVGDAGRATAALLVGAAALLDVQDVASTPSSCLRGPPALLRRCVREGKRRN